MAPRSRWKRCESAGVSDFVASPDQPATDQPIYWTTETDPGVIHLVNTPSLLVSASDLLVEFSHTHLQQDEAGLHMRAKPARDDVQIALLPDVHIRKPLAAVIPLDSKVLDRLASIYRFVKMQAGRSAPDKRLTTTQRRRIGHMLRAVDGRSEGASYFEIAHALFGKRHIKAPEWQESPFRHTTLRLVRDGRKMINGGYRQLLKFRRRAT